MDVNQATLTAARWAGYAQGASVSNQNATAPAPGENTSITNTQNPQTNSAPGSDTLTLSVKTVFRQQATLSLNFQQTADAGESDEAETTEIESDDDHDEHDEQRKQVAGNLSASISQSLLNVVSVTRQSALSVESPAEQTTEQPANDEAALADAGASTSVITLGGVSASRNLASSLQLTTAEGDVVTVELSRSQSQVAGNVNTDNSALAFVGASSSSQISINIEGELNEKESKAIEHVIKRVNQLAEKLFEGKIGAAFGKLQSLDVNTKQLSGIALNMSSSLSLTAVSAYSQVNAIATEAANAPATETVAGVDANNSPAIDSASASAAPVQAESAQAEAVQQPAAEVATQAVQEAGEVVNETADAEVFDNPFTEIRKLFAAIADSFAAMNQAIGEQQNDFVKRLFNDVVDRVEADREDDHDADDAHDVENVA